MDFSQKALITLFRLNYSNTFYVMLIGELADARMTVSPIFKVSARKFLLDTRCNDSGVKANAFVSHPVMVYYCLLHAQANTRHSIKGNI